MRICLPPSAGVVALSENGAQNAPTVADRVQVANTMYSQVPIAGNPLTASPYLESVAP